MSTWYQPELADGSHYLSPEESRHCLKVLRRKVGDRIVIVDGNGLKATAEITIADPGRCEFRIIEEEQQTEGSFEVHIAEAPTKNQDRIEWFVEKAVEIGIQSIDLYYGQHSERRKIKLDRLTKKAISAMKQSGQSVLPEIVIHEDFTQLINAKSNCQEHYIAFVDFSNPQHLADVASKGKKTVVLIGPEGDFSATELEYALESGYRKVSLGAHRLRTETAALAACHILNLLNR